MINTALLQALQHADSAFPSGSFAFSQGLEGSAAMIASGGGFDVKAFVRVQLHHRWLDADRVALVRAHRARRHLETIRALDEEVEFSTAASSMREGSRRNGQALLVAHDRLGSIEASRYRALVRGEGAHGHLAVMQGYLWGAAGMELDTAIAVSAYQFASSLCTAAVRLGLIGALKAQRLLGELLLELGDTPSGQIAADDPLTSFAPLAEIAVMNHGRAGQRLFSN